MIINIQLCALLFTYMLPPLSMVYCCVILGNLKDLLLEKKFSQLWVKSVLKAYFGPMTNAEVPNDLTKPNLFYAIFLYLAGGLFVNSYLNLTLPV